MIKSLWIRPSLMRHLILGFLMTSIVPLTGLALSNLSNFESALIDTVVTNMAFIADKKADKINHYIEDSRKQVRSFAYMPDVIALFEALQKHYQIGTNSHAYQQIEIKAQRVLNRIISDYGYYDLLLIDTSGEVVFSIKKEADFATNLQTGRYRDSILATSFRQSMDFLTTEFSTFTIYEPSESKAAAFTTTPLWKNGMPIGVLAVQTNLDTYYPIITDSTGLGKTGEALLAKKIDNTVFFTTPRRYSSEIKQGIPIQQLAKPMVAALNGQRGQGISIDYVGHPVVAAWRYLPDLHWGMVVKIDTSEALMPLIKLRFYTFLALGALISIVTAFAIFLGKSITHPVRDLMQVTKQIAKGDLNQRVPVYRHDEFGELAQTFNHMSEQIKQGYDSLEHRVQSRTAELLEAKESAEEALTQLKMTQTTLVQAEKMAALGGLVAGIAHEINTPIGITLTSATHLNTRTNTVAKLYEQGELEENELNAYFKVAEKSTQLITINSQRAADLIHSFKQVAVDQTSGERREFDLKSYIEEVLLSLKPALKKSMLKIELDCPEKIIMNSYAGAISQLLTNFIMNSLHHAYEPNQRGVLSIHVLHTDEDWIQLVYSDDGKGIPVELQAKVFDPFFTTRRGSGGSGLGLHIVYNIVYQTLKGSLTLQSTENGTTFTVQFPRSLPYS